MESASACHRRSEPTGPVEPPAANRSIAVARQNHIVSPATDRAIGGVRLNLVVKTARDGGTDGTRPDDIFETTPNRGIERAILNMTQEELANKISVSRQTINALLQGLEREQLLVCMRGGVRIVDFGRLLELEASIQ